MVLIIVYGQDAESRNSAVNILSGDNSTPFDNEGNTRFLAVGWGQLENALANSILEDEEILPIVILKKGRISSEIDDITDFEKEFLFKQNSVVVLLVAQDLSNDLEDWFQENMTGFEKYGLDFTNSSIVFGCILNPEWYPEEISRIVTDRRNATRISLKDCLEKQKPIIFNRSLIRSKLSESRKSEVEPKFKYSLAIVIIGLIWMLVFVILSSVRINNTSTLLEVGFEFVNQHYIPQSSCG